MPGEKRRTVAQLAKDAELDPDEALLTLWEAGFGDLLRTSDSVYPRGLKKARAALGLATRAEIKSLEYWRALLGLGMLELLSLLDELGVQASDRTKTVPPGGVTRLKAEARRRGIDPATGATREPIAHQDKSAEPTPAPRRAELPPSSAFKWSPPGREREMRRLTATQVESIHMTLAADFALSNDPIAPAGVREQSLLESAVFRPQTSLNGILKYPSVESASAALLHSLILNHPFQNGNKRTALVAMLVMLDENGVYADCHEDELFRLVLQTAQHLIVDLSITHILCSF